VHSLRDVTCKSCFIDVIDAGQLGLDDILPLGMIHRGAMAVKAQPAAVFRSSKLRGDLLPFQTLVVQLIQ
jgi:hypothetical protein